MVRGRPDVLRRALARAAARRPASRHRAEARRPRDLRDRVRRRAQAARGMPAPHLGQRTDGALPAGRPDGPRRHQEPHRHDHAARPAPPGRASRREAGAGRGADRHAARLPDEVQPLQRRSRSRARAASARGRRSARSRSSCSSSSRSSCSCMFLPIVVLALPALVDARPALLHPAAESASRPSPTSWRRAR